MQLLKYVLPPYSEQRQNGGAISLPPHIKKNDNKFLYNNSPNLYINHEHNTSLEFANSRIFRYDAGTGDNGTSTLDCGLNL